jgi:hypothetical protein
MMGNPTRPLEKIKKIEIVIIYLCLQELKQRYQTESQFFLRYQQKTVSDLVSDFHICPYRISPSLYDWIFSSFLSKSLPDHKLIQLELSYPNSLVPCFFMFYLYDIHDYWRSRICSLLSIEWNHYQNNSPLLEYLYQHRKKAISKSCYQSIQKIESQYLSIEKRQQILNHFPQIDSKSISCHRVKKWDASLIDLREVFSHFYFYYFPHHEERQFSTFIGKKKAFSCCEFNQWLDYLPIYVLSNSISHVLTMFSCSEILSPELYKFDPVFSFLLQKHMNHRQASISIYNYHSSSLNNQLLWNQNLHDWIHLFPPSDFKKEYILEFMILFSPFLWKKKRSSSLSSHACPFLDDVSKQFWFSIQWKSSIESLSITTLFRLWSSIHPYLLQYLEKKNRMRRTLQILSKLYHRTLSFYNVPIWNNEESCLLTLPDSLDPLVKSILLETISSLCPS